MEKKTGGTRHGAGAGLAAILPARVWLTPLAPADDFVPFSAE
jgi:hypothetical protein